MPFEVSRSPEQFHELLIRERVTVLNQTPSAFRQLVAADGASQNTTPLSLRTIIFGGEALEMQSLRPWFDRHGDARPQLVNMYGITETTVHVTYRPLTAADTQAGSVIGEPIPDLKVYILDPQQRPVPIGVPGELHVGGDGLARGYLYRPELTAGRFIENPFVPGERLYRTGDLARWLPGRDIEYLGRIDQQVKIRGFRIELGEIESVLARHPHVAEAAVLARADAADGKRLIAWFVARPGTTPDAASLRNHLRQFLPDYMVPAAFVQIERLPLTNNGKLDAKALPAPGEQRPDLGSAFTAPRSAAEEKIATVWRRVLKLDRVGIDDNFFELGGDSILSILIVAQCRKAGIAITPKHIYDHPTIAGLAGLSAPSAPLTPERKLEGTVPLTPIQRWFFDHDFADARHWNQSFVFELPPWISDDQLAAAFATVFSAHPVFALSFFKTADGWLQQVRAQEKPATISLRCDTASSPSAIEIQSSFSLEGPLLRYARTGKFLTIAAHHLIMDGVSWKILLADLDAALCSKLPGKPTTGFHTWAHALEDAARSPALRDELPFWQSVCASATRKLPLDHPGGDNSEASTETLTTVFGAAETAALLRDLPAHNLRVQDALLAALAHGLSSLTGHAEFTVEVEGHGREEAAMSGFTGMTADLSHTIGWFTTIFPVALRACGTTTGTLAHTAKSLAAVPGNGFGYSLLRHLTECAENLRIEPQVLFNFLGQFDNIASDIETLRFADAATASWRAPGARRTHLLEINSLVIHGRLEIRWNFSTGLHHRNTIARAADVLAAALRDFIAHAAPAQFALARCDTAPLLRLHPDAADIYPLTPMQRLFFTLEMARPGSGTDQWHARITGPLDAARLQAAWHAALCRHPAIRTAYAATEIPHAVVLKDARPEWHAEDLRNLPHDQQERRFAAFLAADAAQPFDLATPPLTRLALFRTAENEHRFVWTHHHLEIDGWSWPVLFHDVAMLYAGKDLPAAPPYRDFIGWLASRATGRDGQFWREYLLRFRAPTPLPLPPPDRACDAAVEITAFFRPLDEIAQRLQVTPNIIVQAAWALLLAHHSGEADVVFGAALSGRPADLADSEGIVGHFVNNVPIRAEVGNSEPFPAIARRMHLQFAYLTAFQHTSLSDIHASSELPWNARLFQTLVVFQNYGGSDSAMHLGGATITDCCAPVRTNYPLTLAVTPGDGLRLTLITLPRIASHATASALLDQLTAIFAAVCEDPERTVSEITSILPSPATVPASAGSPAKSATQDAPATETERIVAEVWREAFGRPVGASDNFFDIGGHSLLMLQVHARLSERLGRSIPVVKFFQHPNIRSIARFLAGDTPKSATVSDARERAARAKAAQARRPLTPRIK